MARFLLGAIGEPGHAFPAIALGGELRRRGHEVAIHTWKRWREPVEATGVTFVEAPVFELGPERTSGYSVHEAANRAAHALAADLDGYRPDVVVADVLTLGPSLAAEVANIPFATLVPHLYQVSARDEPPFASGFAPIRRQWMRHVYRRLSKPYFDMIRQGVDDLNVARQAVGLAPESREHGGLSQDLVLVATLPQLEPPRDLPDHVKICGPLQWEPPAADTPIPPGDDPLVVVAPSTSQDPYHTLLEASLRGLANQPLRVLATLNGRAAGRRLPTAPNIHLVDWLKYSQAFAAADVVICHGGHGTLMRALAAGAAVVISPISGDQFENAARVRWAKVGVSLPPRLRSPRTVRLAVERLLSNPALRANARALGAWSGAHDGAATAARELEAFAADRAAPGTAGKFPATDPR